MNAIPQNKIEILFLYCLGNDEGHEMSKMGEMLKGRVDPEQYRVHSYAIKGPSDETKSIKKAKKSKSDFEVLAGQHSRLSEVRVISHHAFYNHSFRANQDLTPLELKDRTIGGFEIDYIARCVQILVLNNPIQNTIFYGCEMGIATPLPSQPITTGPSEPSQAFQCRFDMNHCNHINGLVQNNQSTHVSTLAYLANSVFEEMNKNPSKVHKSVNLIGLNGVGYICDHRLRSFDSKNHQELRAIKQEPREIRQSPKKAKATKSQEQKESSLNELDFEENYVNKRSDFHTIAYQLQNSGRDSGTAAYYSPPLYPSPSPDATP